MGVTDNNGSTNHDVIVLKYNSLGVLQWDKTYDGPDGKNDVGTALKIDANGNIYVVTSSESTTTDYDYRLLKYTSGGTLSWNSTYDFSNLVEIPISVDIDGNGDIFVAGASAETTNDWDYAIAKFDANGTYLGDERSNVPGIGFDQPFDYHKDNSGNIYITGQASTNSIDYDIKTIKLNSAYVLQWSTLINNVSLEDVGHSVDVDASGNVYVGGFVTNSSNVKEIIVVKYNSLGVEQWRHTQASIDPTGDAIVWSIDAIDNGGVYFVGEEKGLNGSQDLIVGKLKIMAAFRGRKS